MTGLAILAILSLGWHILLTLCVARAARRALKKVSTLDRQISNLERLDAHLNSIQAALDHHAPLDREHMLLTLCVARAVHRALDRLPTLDQQIANLERLQALAESLKAGIERLDELDRQGRADANAMKMLRNYRNN